MQKQITRKCHILPKWYMRNFLKHDGTLLVHKIGSGKIYKDSGRLNFGFYQDTYNYINNHGEVIDDLEKYFSERESKVASTCKKLINDITMQAEKEDTNIGIHTKENILLFMSLLYEKLIYYYYFQTLSKGALDEKQFIISASSFAIMLPLIQIFLKQFLKKNFKWAIIYSKKPLFYFGDFPIHIRGNGPKNNFYDFLKRKGSNLTFPLSKNIMILIESPVFGDTRDEIIKIQYREGIFSELRSNPGEETLSEAIIYRTIENCNEYIAGPYKKILKKAYKGKGKSNTYTRDIFLYVLCDIIPNIMQELEKDIDLLQQQYYAIFESYTELKIKRLFLFLKKINSIRNYKIKDFIMKITEKPSEEVDEMINLPLRDFIHTIIKRVKI